MMENNGMPFTMDVVPAGSNNCGGSMGGWDSWIWIILVFALIWGNNGFGGFSGNGGGALTRGELCQDMNFNDLQSAVRSSAAENNANFRTIDNSVCQLGYNNAQLANDIQMLVANRFSNLDTELCQVGNNVAQQFNNTNIALMQAQNALQSQIADCCCENRQAIAQVRYDSATNTRDIIESQNSNTRAILDYLCKDKIETLQSENQSLKLAASQCAQNQYLVEQLAPKCPIPAFLTCNPYTGQSFTNGYGYGNSGCCGCNA